MKAPKYILFILATLSFFALKAEGLEELLNGNCGNSGFPQIWDNNDPERPFATYNSAPEYRLYIRLNTGEQLHFGYAVNQEDVWFRIKDPTGAIVMGPTLVQDGDPGWIKDCNKNMNGPKSLSGGGGYDNLTYTAAANGDHYIEFAVNNNAATRQKRVFTRFDLTVENNAGNEIKGRIWSKAWDINCMGGNNPFEADMYVYSADSMVSNLNFNGIRPWGFVISCNSFGASNIGTIEEMRRSDYRQNILDNGGQPGVPEYHLFLNNPDPAEFPTGVIGGLESISLFSCGDPANCINISTTKGGQVEMLMTFPNASQRYFVENVPGGTYCIEWDGLDGDSMAVQDMDSITIETKFNQGLTHLPLTDVENHDNGYSTAQTRPTVFPDSTPLAPPLLHWDDVLLNDPGNSIDGVTNLAGAGPDNAHKWEDRGTNNMNPEVINTWWYFSQELDTFTVICVLPIELTYFKGEMSDEEVFLTWQTATETGNDFFTLGRSANGKNFEAIATVPGAGNSLASIDYAYIDREPLSDVSYYRLSQTDYDGTLTHSSIISVKNKKAGATFAVHPNPITQSNNISFNFYQEDAAGKEILVVLYDVTGREIFSKLYIQENNGIYTAIDPADELNPGIYLITASSNNEIYNQKLVVR